jgi:transcriptional regulator with XRE-family HTH domain
MVTQRPTFHPEIGAFLVHLRQMKGWSQRRAVSVARQRGIALSLGSLRFVEEGKTKYPDRVLLAGIASLYDVPFEMLVQRFVEANYGVEIQVRASGTSSSESATFNPTLARVMELEARVAKYQSTIGELRSIVERSGVARRVDEKKGTS